MIKLPVLSLGAALLFNLVQAQEYREKMLDENANFYEVKQLAEDYFQEDEKRRGTGYKQYKRWEYQTEKRVYPSGDLSLLNKERAHRYFKDFQIENSQETREVSSNWILAGPENWNYSGSWNPGQGRVNAIAEHPTDPNTLFACVPAGGLWKSSNGGSTWSCISDDFVFVGTSCIAFDSGNPDIMYLGTGDRDGGDSPSYGVFKSVDGGSTWVVTSLSNNQTGNRIYELKAHPTNANEVYAACANGFFKSTDAGNSWSEPFTSICHDFEFKPGSPSTMYLISNSSFYKSTNGAVSFSQITSGLPASSDRVLIEVTADDPNYVYYLYSDGSLYGGLCRSTNSGTGFSTMSTQSSIGNIFGYSTTADDFDGQAWYDMALAISPVNKNEVHIGGVITWRSTNGGSSFTATSEWTYPNNRGYTHADIHFIKYFGNNLYVGSDGGAFKSTNQGGDFTDLSSGLAISQFYKFDLSQDAVPRIIAGAQDNGTTVHRNSSWNDWLGADGMDCAIDHGNSNIMYGSVQNGSFYKTNNGGDNTVNIDGNLNGPWVTPITMDPNNSSVIYAGTQQLSKTTNGMGSWSVVSSFSGTDNIEEIAVAKTNSNIVYVGRGSSVYKSSNAGSNWSEVSSSLPNLYVSYIAIDPNDENTVLVTFSGASAGNKVFKSLDGGSSWTNVSLNLPNMSANSIVISNNEVNSMYVAMDYGIYYTDDQTASWEEFSTNFPLAPTSELRIHEPSGYIYAATYGRGIWKSLLYSPNLVALDGMIQNQTTASVVCAATYSPLITLTNSGSASMSSVLFEYSIGGGTYTYTWTGNLESGENTSISLDEVNLSDGTQNFICSIVEVNGQSDENNSNDIISVDFEFLSGTPENFSVNILPDNYAADISWTLVNTGTNATVGTGQGYTDGDLTLISEEYLSENGCYELTISDSYGDGVCCDYGQGDILVTNVCGDTLAHHIGDYTTSLILEFCIDMATSIEEMEMFFDVYPNPSHGVFFINSPSNFERVNVYNALGELMLEESSRKIDLSSYSKGVYFVEISCDGQISKKKKIVLID